MRRRPTVRMRALMHRGEMYICRADLLEVGRSAANDQAADTCAVVLDFLNWVAETTKPPRAPDE